MNFSLDQLTAFVTTVEQGSFKQAAQLLNKHATTVSQQVAALEIDINMTLFDRKVRKLQLTAQGREFYNNAKPLITEAGHLNARLTSMHGNLPSHLRVAIDPTIRDRQLIRCIKQVSDAFPTVEIEVISGDPKTIIEQLAANSIDIGVFTTLFSVIEGVSLRPLFNFELVFIGDPQWVAKRNEVDDVELRGTTQLIHPYIEQQVSLQGHKLSNHFLKVESLADLLDMVSLGMGWAIVPKFQVQQLLDDGELAPFTVTGGKSVNWYAELGVSQQAEINPAMQCFIEAAMTLSDR